MEAEAHGSSRAEPGLRSASGPRPVYEASFRTRVQVPCFVRKPRGEGPAGFSVLLAAPAQRLVFEDDLGEGCLAGVGEG